MLTRVGAFTFNAIRLDAPLSVNAFTKIIRKSIFFKRFLYIFCGVNVLPLP